MMGSFRSMLGLVVLSLPGACIPPKGHRAPSPAGDSGASDSYRPTDGDTALDLVLDDVDGRRRAWRIFDFAGSTTIVDGGAGLVGEVSYFISLDDEVLCDARIALTGTEYTGECDFCDYVFAIEPSIEENYGTSHCPYDPSWTYIPDYSKFNLGWGFAQGYPYDFAYGIDQVIVTVFETDRTTGWARLAMTGDYPSGSLTYGDGEYTWSVFSEAYHSSIYNLYYHHNMCGDIHTERKSIGSAYGYTLPPVYSTLDCGNKYVDIWQVGARAGDHISVTVDTVASDTAFQPWVWLNDPDDCSVVESRKTFDCTEGDSLRCASLDWFAEMDGPHEITVYPDRHCVADTVEYKLMVAIE